MSLLLSEKPIIGILCDIYKKAKEDSPRYFVKSNYVSAIKDAGGIPLLISPLIDKEDSIKTLDIINGLIVPGGDDIDPKYFNEKPHPSIILIDPEIIKFQIEFCRLALGKDMPVFGVCAGHQIINIACGGNIYQDIPSQFSKALKHKKDENERDDPVHTVSIESGTKLRGILQRGEVKVNSTHHQALRDIAEGFIVSARSEDGIIEAIESKKHNFVIGVQWHPEDLYREHKLFLKLFEQMVHEATLYH